MNFFLSILILLFSSFVCAAAPSLDWREIEKDWQTWVNTSEPELKKKVLAGDPVAKYFYFHNSREDQSGGQDISALADKCLAQAAEAGVPHALFDYALEFYGKDYSKYFQLLQKGASTGLPTILLRLAEEHLEGQRAPLDEARAVDLTRQAADAGYPAALFELAEMYACGMGEPRHDRETPFQLHLQAASNGFEDAFLPLANRYLTGRGTDQNLLEASRWFWRARQSRIRIYEDLLNEDFPPLPLHDPQLLAFKEFFALYESAQEKRDPEAMFNVGQAFLRGKQGSPNPATAYVWLSLAHRAGITEAASLLETAKSQLPQLRVSELDKEIATMHNTPRQGRPQR